MTANKYKVLEDQIAEIPSLIPKNAHGPETKLWKDTTTKVVSMLFGPDYVALFEKNFRVGRAVFIHERQGIHQKQLTNAETLLKGMIDERKKLEHIPALVVQGNFTIDKYEIHPQINKVSGKLFADGYYAEAIRAAYVEVINRTGRHMAATKNQTLDGQELMDFAFREAAPSILFNGFSNKSEKNEQTGLGMLFRGIVGVRNMKSHNNITQDNPYKAVEYLCLASLQMRLLDEASVGP